MKKIFSLMLVFILAFGVTGNVFAASSNNEKTKKVVDMETDIKNEIELARKEIYRQLKQQDALVLMEVYEDIIYPQIEQQIKAEYSRNKGALLATESRRGFYAPNGGLVTYLHPISGYKPTEVAVTCLNRSDSYDYLLLRDSFSISSLLKTILGYVPYVGGISGTLMDMDGVVDSIAKRNIYKAGGCAQIINTYSREWGTKASIINGWTDRYDIFIPVSATDVTFKRF